MLKKDEQISLVAKMTGETKASINAVLDAFFQIIQDELMSGNDIALTGIGKLTPVQRKARTIPVCGFVGGKPVEVPEHIGVRFKASSTLIKLIN